MKKLKSLKVKIVSIFMTLAMVTSISGLAVTSSPAAFVGATEAVVGVSAVFGALVVVIFASAVMGTIGNNTADASTSLNASGYSDAAGIADLWPLGVVLMVFVGIFAAIL